MRRLLAGAAALLVGLLAVPPAARADLAFVPDSVQAAVLGSDGRPDLRAGAHPDRLVASFTLRTIGGGPVDGSADGNVKDIAIDLPPGLVGDAGAVPACPRSSFYENSCPAESQVGVVRASFAGFFTVTLPVNVIAPTRDEFAELGFFVGLFPVRLVFALRTSSDYGMQIAIHDLPQNLPLTAAQMEMWGVPADHQAGTAIPRKAFLTNPTGCDGRLSIATVRVRSWQQPGRWLTGVAPPVGPFTGCDRLAFDPALDLALDTPTADTPSGMSVAVTLPQRQDPSGLATGHLRDLAITLPAGLTMSPGVADGLGACADAQLGVGTLRPPACPTSSKIGTVRLDTPLLSDPLTGSIYLGRALPGDRYRLFLAARGRGVVVRVRGSLQPDPETGQLFITLTGLPALPIDRIALRLKGGPRAPLATPPGCGAGAGTASVTPYGGPPERVIARIEIASGPAGARCAVATPFTPLFVAGSSPALGGAGGAFSMTVQRADGEQLLDRVRMTLPAGLTARLTRIARCPAARAARGACPRGSRIGTVAAEAGAGPSPLPLAGSAYLTGPYQGAPFGLALVLRAHAGPFDLGTAVVRATLQLDPLDARLTIATGELPRVLAGVPLRLKTLAIDIDRPGFLRNPTSCRRTRVTAAISSIDEASVGRASPYALRRCERLGFSPRVSMSLTSRQELRRGGHPGVAVGLRLRPGDAALRSAAIALPEMLRLDVAAAATICTRERARAGRCPRASAIGSARMRTPLLPRPLTGTVDVVQPRHGAQPDLWATVRGMGVRLSVRSTTFAPAGGPIVAHFRDLPDMPLSSLDVQLRGGAHGLLELVGGLCAHGKPARIVADARLRAQNGKRRLVDVPVPAAPACTR